MGLEKIKNYFEPKSILDIGANVGQFYNESKLVFSNSYYYLIEGNENCEVVLKTLGVDYSISLLSANTFSFIILGVIMLSVNFLCIIMLSVNMFNVTMLGDNTLGVKC